MHIARFLHLLAVVLLALLAQVLELNILYLVGVGGVALLLIYEHRLVRVDDLSRLDMAFFTMNGIISVVYFAFTLADLLILGNGWSLLIG